jgi:DNA/RNA endonuclease G (NUC1)
MDWADKHGQIWVICGPVFFNKNPSMWLGQDGEKKIAIPDALFKIVIREVESPNQVETLAFIIPNILPKEERQLEKFLTSIARIEELTGLRFLTALDEQTQARIKITQAASIDW